MHRVSACPITLNEEHNLPLALASLAAITDEIVVMEAGCADGRVIVAKQHSVAE